MALFSMAISGGVRSAEQSADLPKVPRLSYPPPFKDVQVELPATITVQPEYRPRLPLYLALRPHFSPLLAKAILNVTRPPESDANARPAGQAPADKGKVGKWVYSFGSQSGLLYISDPIFSGPEYVGRAKKSAPTDAVTQANAAKMAESFLKGRGLWPDGAVMSRVLENWRGLTYMIVFRHQISGLPYMVAGDRLEIDLDRASGGLHTLLFQWSSFQLVAEYPIMTAQEAVARINQGQGLREVLDRAEPVRGTITEVLLSYYAIQDHTAYAQPVYRFTVVPKDGKGEKTYIRIQAIRPEFISEEFEKTEETAGDDPADSKTDRPLARRPAAPVVHERENRIVSADTLRYMRHLITR